LHNDFVAFGMYSGDPSPRSALHDRVIGSAHDEAGDPDEMALQYIQPGALEFLVQKALYHSAETVAPPQYAVFDVVGSPATIFNFNLDGLASAYCNYKHIVIEPHGHIDRLWFENDAYEYWRKATMAWDVMLPHITPKVLPAPEPPDLIRSLPYQRARHLFLRSPALIMVGYSFGKAGGGLDDSRSWQFFVDLLKAFPRPAFVLSPFPEELADTPRQALSSSDVFGIPVYWESLATCLAGAAGPSHGLPSTWCDNQLHDLIYQYERMVDSR